MTRWAIAVASAFAACDGGGPLPPDPSSPSPTGAATEVAEPCPEGAGEDHELGNPDRGGRYATFEVTRESDLWVTARRFEHGGPFDPETGRTAIYIGDVGRPPTYDEQRSRVENTTFDTQVVEGTWSRLPLPTGTYWLWTTTGATSSCAAASRQSYVA